MLGSELVPLNQMIDSKSKLQAKYLKKYKGREEILDKNIQLLDCLWNDVVQFLPIDPVKIFKIQVELGLIPRLPPYKFFEIDLSILDPNKTVVYFKSSPGEENVQVKWLADVDFAKLQEVPEATINYYKSLIGSGELPFNYQFVPHVVSMDIIDISRSEIKTLS